MRPANCGTSSGLTIPSRKISANPEMEVSGVFSSCDMKADEVLKESRRLLDANPPHEPRQHSAMDDSFLLEKQFQKVYDGIAGRHIEELKDRIEEQKQTISIQRDTIEYLKRENESLRKQLSKYQTDEILSHHPFPMGVADKDIIQPEL